MHMVLQPVTVKLSEKEISFLNNLVKDDYALTKSEAVRKMIHEHMEDADRRKGSDWTEVNYRLVGQSVTDDAMHSKVKLADGRHAPSCISKTTGKAYMDNSMYGTSQPDDQINRFIKMGIMKIENGKLMVADKESRAKITMGQKVDPRKIAWTLFR